MAEIFRTRCTAGWLIITDQAIRIERKGLFGAGSKMQVLPRQALIGVSMENKMAPVFGQGGATTMTFSGYGAVLIAKMVVLKDARKIMELLGYA
jgi:1,4-dihydroxy-2-naphthoyl-CoA synthase